MSEEPQVVSIPSNASLSPDEISRKSFPAVRKGIDGEEVRSFLTKVAVELREALEREALVRERLAEAERRLADPVLDEATLTRAIGVETAKILSTAHEAANNVVTKAEAKAAELVGRSERVLAEQVAIAEAEASAIRAAAEQEAAEYAARAHAEAEAMTDEAHADAVELLDATKEECRRMVAEARELRNRTLADLVARRAALRVQLEELRGGKDSLLGVVDAVGVAVEALRERLASAEDQARLAAEEAGARAETPPGHDELGELEAELAAGTVLVPGDLGRSSDKADELVGETVGEAAHEGSDVVPGGPGTGLGGPSSSRRSVDELFARIRASRAAEEAAAAALAAGQAVGAHVEGDAGANGVGVLAAAAPADEGPSGTSVGEQTGGSPGELERTAEIAAVVVEPVTEAEAEPGSEPGEDDVAADLLALEPVAAANEPGEGDTPAEETFPVSALQEAPSKSEVPTDEVVEAGADDLGPSPEAVEVVVVVEARVLGDDAITEPDVESLARRDHLLSPVTAKLGRALKRALQDDQNELLNALRQTSRKPVLDELVPLEAQHERFVVAATDQLAKAFEAGAAFLVTGDSVEGPSVSASPPSELSAFEAGAVLAAELADDLSLVLRLRIEEALGELDGSSEGSADAAGVAYREWKGSRVEGLAGDFTTRAFAVGELAVLDSVTNGVAPLVRWAVEDDDGGGSCPDCDDNSLAGPMAPGSAFPTGHSHPPVHPGCRCLLVPVRS